MPPTLKDLALKYMREQICTGGWSSGYRLSDLLISKDIGISRTPVREAINQLIAEGLAEMRPHDGAFVKTVSRRDIEELYELRIILECHCARKAALNCSPELLRKLESNLAVIESIAGEVNSSSGFLTAEQTVRQRSADLAFHQAMIASAANSRLDKIIGDSRILAQLFSVLSGNLALDSFNNALFYHRRLLESVRSGDSGAAEKAMSEHLESALTLALEKFTDAESSAGRDIPPALRKFI